VVRRLIQVRFVALPNLIAEREIYPERLQQACAPEPLTAALLPLLTDPAARDAQRAGLRGVAADLGAGSEPPSARAAAAVLKAARTALLPP
jgi:lipid-A-disaccharide synthase